MATFARNKVMNQLSWATEGDRLRAERRRLLCELDGMLTQLEEMNLRGTEVPRRMLVGLRRRGVAIRPRGTTPDLIEAIFVAQEQFMRQPEGLLQGDPFPMGIRRRMAS